ncbi:unnamed protein product [Staurois parvus]|uniref:Uncharacterized protein n=1 Tax=Staurois parvus TaxID=386267 RepID=A0ABN9AS40_9NEOB|nr:unnamed protein product [Staurois parvus]
MGPYIPPPHAAAKPLICHGPLYTAAPHCCCQVQSLSWVPSTASIAAVLHRHTSDMCHFQVSSTLLGVLNFLT